MLFGFDTVSSEHSQYFAQKQRAKLKVRIQEKNSVQQMIINDKRKNA